jgi:hypothetical protein
MATIESGDADPEDAAPSSSSPPQPPSLSPLTWTQVVAILDSGDLAQLRRSPAQQADYERYMATVVRPVWDTTADFLQCTKFGVAVGGVNPTSGKQVSAACQQQQQQSPSSLQSAERSRLCLLRNDFPYHFDATVDHWILWKWRGGPVTAAEVQAAQAELCGSDDDNNNNSPRCCRHWVTPPGLQSIPQIHHVHIVVFQHSQHQRTCRQPG